MPSTATQDPKYDTYSIFMTSWTLPCLTVRTVWFRVLLKLKS